ncbi:protein-disulfide reductase DsbD [Aquabacterium sp.]|uniref:protein-disulfide reductase DsbD n=1 Tax=Aquabacterium sp. TaxID=1872578 RepID=UPI00248A4636|nr:protein-disulfide reductase DsbD [Aquabacterium sp.]MDI1259889.1 protein-disulfide reductase DsbD [Aquabacterium sp.]
MVFRIVLASVAGWLLATPCQAEEFLPADQAFTLQASTTPKGQVQIDFSIVPKTYLYRDRFRVESKTPSVTLTPMSLPPGQRKFDETFGKEVEVYHGLVPLQFGLTPATPAGTSVLVEVGYQGCADAGLCYPPQTKHFTLTAGQGGLITAIVGTDEGTPKSSATPSTATSGSRIETALASGNLPTIIGVFLVAGLLLSFTPCVLPMMPILSAVIIGQGKVGRLRGFILALSYSQGMALVYTLLGVSAGLLGEGLAASLQNPWVLGSFSALMVLLSLSMFGVYELQMPAFIQGHLTKTSGKLQGGSLLGVFLMGVVSALIVGPCVSAPLAGALVYLSQTKDVVLGGVALYALACGMSLPLLLLGLSAGSLLPSAGRWMEAVKTLFGLMLLGVAWWLVYPLLPPLAATLSLGALLALASAFTGGFDTLTTHVSLKHRSALALGLVLALLSAVQIIGGLAGAQSPWDPLRPFVAHASAGATQGEAANALAFKRVSNSQELDEAVAAATQSGQAVMLDFYADWCVSCKEMEHFTFSDARVQARLKNVVLLQADVTANSADHKALLKRFNLFGPPGILFFDAQGRLLSQARVIGFQNADVFLKSLEKAGL